MKKKILIGIAVFVFWIAVWQGLSMLVNKEVLLPAPFSVVKRLFGLIRTSGFHKTVLLSCIRIFGGFLIAFFSGCIFGVICAKIKIIDLFLSPVISTIKATPVASFIILTLVWIDKQTAPLFISFLMVFPIIFSNVKEGINSTDKKLLEMARVFEFPKSRILTKIYFPSLIPYLTAGLKASLGIAWKSGVAAEVICQPSFSIGKFLYESKLNLETVDLFAWTVAVILISIIIEKAVIFILNTATKKSKRKAADHK